MKTEKECKSIAESLNLLRTKNEGITFHVSELENVLQGILPTSCLAKTVMVKVGIVERVNKGYYQISKNPIHWKKVQNFFNTCYEKQRSYSNSYAKNSLYGIPIEKIAKDLKALGYHVFKEV